MILIYATKPEVKCLKLVRDKEDVGYEIDRYLTAAENRAQAAEQQQAETGGTVSTAALVRWKSAKWVEVEIDMT